MGFLTPLYLFGAALIALPVILHLLRRGRRAAGAVHRGQPAAQEPGGPLASGTACAI
jgi:hypothetical protein